MKRSITIWRKWLAMIGLTLAIAGVTETAQAQKPSLYSLCWNNWDTFGFQLEPGFNHSISNWWEAITETPVAHEIDSSCLRYNLFLLHENLKACQSLFEGSNEEPQMFPENPKLSEEKGTDQSKTEPEQAETSKTEEGTDSPEQEEVLPHPQTQEKSKKRNGIWNHPGTMKIRI